MTAHIIDGKAAAAMLRKELKQKIARLKKERGITPGLAVVLVGNNAASEVYVRNKAAQTREVGMESFEHHLPKTTTEAELLALITKLNHDPSVHGILVQLPLPPQLHAEVVINAIAPHKDVDGFHVVNAGNLATEQEAIIPCTPQGCVKLLHEVCGNLSGLHAVIIGRSNIVGKPMAQLLLEENCTVTIAHSRTRNLPDITRQADILVAAVGRPKMVKGDWIKPGAAVIDVGINRVVSADGKSMLVGDVDFEEAVKVAGAITPVPGGVGPMTIACLLKNTLNACLTSTKS